jgi:hypothetical protein
MTYERCENGIGMIEEQSQRLSAVARTTMSCPLSIPPDILDLITDHLRDERTTLKTCCVISKSWVHPTRRHLFLRIDFYARKSHVELWKKTFPDPSNSPARYTRSLSIHGIPHVTTADMDVGGWIRTFRNLVHLHLECFGPVDHEVSLAPFHGISPTLRSLRLTCAFPEVLDLICSFPLLEDLALDSIGNRGDVWSTPSTSPKFTGTLEITAFGGFRPIARRLLDLPGGLHFAKIKVESYAGDVDSTMDLVSGCSGTLKSLYVSCSAPGVFPSTSASGQYLTATRGCRDVWDAFV